VLVFAVAASPAACTAHFNSTAQVDGVAFSPISCTSGQRAGFPGLEFVGATGERLRVVQQLDGSGNIAYFPAGSRLGEQVNACASIDVRSGVGVINGSRNLEGTVTLACQTERQHRITGALQFENCH
jgi:hypothetical protein